MGSTYFNFLIMKDDVKNSLQMIQSGMVESAQTCFSESEIDDLRCIIRLTIEFYDYLQNGNPQLLNAVEHAQNSLGIDIQFQPNEHAQTYTSESIFSGINSFCHVSAAYRVLVGSTKSSVKWDMISKLSLKKQFIPVYLEFTSETNFEKKCRLLLDLFKIQIVFAGISYD